MNQASEAMAGFAEIDWGERRVRVEYAFVGDAGTHAPLIVFLHEGLGSVAMWRGFPERLCRAAAARGLVWSRPGYGRSTPRAAHEKWRPDFMHRQAHEVLPRLLHALRIDGQGAPLWLFGHSDGGSIALLYAARSGGRRLGSAAAASPAVITPAPAGVVVLAPHIRVEDVSVQSIAKAKSAYLETDLRERLTKYHDDVDSAFWGWNDIWLDPAFRRWSIEDEIGTIACPVLAIQGVDDEYGTLEQVRGIARRVPQTRVLELAACSHSPHRDRPDEVVAAVREFVARAAS